MARRQTARQAVEQAREKHPSARVEVLYPASDGMFGTSWAFLPETDWDSRKVANVCEYTDGKGTVSLIHIETI